MSENSLQVAQGNEILSVFNPAQFEAMQRVANMFANSELVPDMYKASANNPKEKAIANCVVALEMSNRIGASPLAVMQNMIIIYGRPSWSSKFLISTVNTCGRFHPLQFHFEENGVIGKVQYVDYVYENNKKKAVNKEFDGSQIPNLVCYAHTTARRSSSGETRSLIGSEIDLIMAIKEGWYLKAGSKWRTMPKQMLMYRAASFWTSVYAPELSMGMRTVEEEQDIHDVDAEIVSSKIHEADRRASQNANKQTMSFDEAQPADEPAPSPNETPASQPQPETMPQSQPEPTPAPNKNTKPTLNF